MTARERAKAVFRAWSLSSDCDDEKDIKVLEDAITAAVIEDRQKSAAIAFEATGSFDLSRKVLEGNSQD